MGLSFALACQDGARTSRVKLPKYRQGSSFLLFGAGDDRSPECASEATLRGFGAFSLSLEGAQYAEQAVLSPPTFIHL